MDEEDCICAECNDPNFSFPEYLQDTAAIIKRVGWANQGVFGTADDPDFIGFTYTIGLETTFRHPEIIVTTLPPQVASPLLNLAADMVKKGLTFSTEEGRTYGDILANGYRVAFRDVDDVSRGNWFNIAGAYYGGYTFRAIRMYVPDAEGLFPWDEGYNHDGLPQPELDDR